MNLKASTRNNTYIPFIYNSHTAKNKNILHTFLQANPKIEIIDEIYCQLEELIKLRFPKVSFTSEVLQKKIAAHIGEKPVQEYGNWVYYPWRNQLIHLLGEEEFIEVRTNRNHYKITPKEAATLAQKKIGIIGLSVGKSIALTIALERICGEMVIADFDIIELSNLNRIQTGVHHFGVKKTIVVAREIAEIDPYLKVSCMHHGLTEDNCDDFFTKNGKLDLCIEVCDGLASKIFARQKAKALQIPVIMNSSDKGTTDIERFDLHPQRPILHGLIDHLDLNQLKKAKTNEEKVPYLLPMIGVETCTTRLRASMLEIEESITTWPQLASGVIIGGGICTDVSRRILLNQFTKSGRFFVDIEELINDKSEDTISSQKTKLTALNSIPTTIKDYKHSLQKLRRSPLATRNNTHKAITSTELKELINYAAMAPSGGNIQPWKWLIENHTLLLFNDSNRSNSNILNYKNAAAFISFGAATENLTLKAQQLGYEVVINPFPLGPEDALIATFQFPTTATDKTEPQQNNELMEFISCRITNRTLGKRISLPKETIHYFKKMVGTIDGAKLHLFTSPEQMDSLKEVITEIDRLFLTNPIGHAHFKAEMRWNEEEVTATRDGIDLDTLDITPTEEAGLIVSKNWAVTKHLKDWNLGKGMGKISAKAIDSSSALGVITLPKLPHENFFAGGRAVQRLWLAATAQKIAFQPMSINTFLFSRIKDNNFEHFEDIKEQLILLRHQFEQITQITDQEKDIFFFRLSKANEPKTKSLRRNLEYIILKND